MSHGRMRAHHVRVGRYFNLLDFCRNGRAVEEGIDLAPKNAEKCDRAYCPIREETAARSFAAALDPLVEQLGRVSVVRGMETAGFADSETPSLASGNASLPPRPRLSRRKDPTLSPLKGTDGPSHGTTSP